VTIRLDSALAERGLARSRTHAAGLIDQGLVTVDGRPVVKASHRVDEGSVIVVASSDHYVSRAAHKLIAALDAFGIDPKGRTVLDAGASTGGFSQVLLERGAERVIAVDVGHGQLAPEMQENPRLRSFEGVNIRYLTRDALEGLLRTPAFLTLVVGDLSFISLTTVLPAIKDLAEPEADFVLLIKPQFEVGRGGVKEGIVHDPGLRADAVTTVLWAAWDLGLGTAGLVSSPIVGSHGNAEYLVHLSGTRGTNPTEWLNIANELAGA
jgi:23S rRNA (cytidine1920-2'-O)/16S rRNA (cytidine1409-2'-O)-methyltransferase